MKLPDSPMSVMLKAGSMKTVLPLSLIAAVAVLARTWQLSQNEFARQYYAAGVRSMLDSWHNFLFNAFDPAGFISIDKPPVAIWLQVAGAKLLGFSALSILLVQVVAGLAAVLIVYALVAWLLGKLVWILVGETRSAIRTRSSQMDSRV